MKEEIKEILDKAKEISDYGADGKQHTRMFNQFEAKALLDYITDLQEEKQRLLESANCLSKGYDDLEEQIDKVVEYIQDNFTNDDGSIWHEDFKKIYNILRGDE